jgi:hypothetical protein
VCECVFCVCVVLFVIATQVRIAQAKTVETEYGVQAKTCSFHCGAKSSDKDPVDTQRLCIRWAYDTSDGPSNSTGTNCWYCERTWSQISHLHVDRDREKFKKLKGKDGDVNSKFKEKRDGVIERTKKKILKGHSSTSAQAIKKIVVRTQKFTSSFVEKPDDWFWPMVRYRKRFGSVNLPKNKKLGHVVSVINGEKGVVVPGDDGTGPFRLKHQSGTNIEEDREESCDSDEEVAAQKFQDLHDEHVQSYKDAAQGVMQDVLMDFAMDSDEIKQEEDKYKAGARKKTEEEER